MAISPHPPPGADPSTNGQTRSAVDIEAWTVEQATNALLSSSITSPPPQRTLSRTTPIRGTSISIEIPLDTERPSKATDRPIKPADAVSRPPVLRSRPSLERDSLRRREALLKGKEGSRRRQRWENDRLLSNPHAQPPLPSDWAVGPTHKVIEGGVPYFLAPLWDAEFRAKAARRRDNESADTTTKIPRDLREKIKKSRAARGLLQDLEMQVRKFIEEWDRRQRELEQHGLEQTDSEDEEIVFVGRNGVTSDEKRIQAQDDRADAEMHKLKRDMMVFESALEDQGASFGRWLVHSIATYYGLETWSVTTGNPARREAYVGLRTGASMPAPVELPRPLWGLV